MDLKEKILVALGLDKEVQLGWQGKSEDGTIFVSTAEELEAGVDISVLTEDGTTILLPVGTYKTEDGISFRVEEEGIVAELIESETEEEDTTEEVEAAEEADVADWKGMEKRIENLEIAVAKLIEAKEGGNCLAFLILLASKIWFAPIVAPTFTLGLAVVPNIGANSLFTNLAADFSEIISLALSKPPLATNKP